MKGARVAGTNQVLLTFATTSVEETRSALDRMIGGEFVPCTWCAAIGIDSRMPERLIPSHQATEHAEDVQKAITNYWATRARSHAERQKEIASRPRLVGGSK
ncbi:MAG TPA: hypothetical protein VGS23_04240 [Thermoplasmata archaeon]|nr:hypothetical protein [Thermoplasmata archaeon]